MFVHVKAKPGTRKIVVLSLMAGILAVTPVLFGSNTKIVMAQQNVIHTSFSNNYCCIFGLTCLRNSPNSEYITADAYLTISGSITQVDSSKFIFQEEVTGNLRDTSTGQTVGTVSGFQTSVHNIGELPGAIAFTQRLSVTCQGSGSYSYTILPLVHVTVDATGQVHDITMT
jgi:hypothetical protein